MAKIILDTDPGVDDAIAILFADSHPDIKLIALTTVYGNATTDSTTRNALYIKDNFNMELDVAKGASRPLNQPLLETAVAVHGEAGLGDFNIPDYTPSSVDSRPAYQYIIDTIKANPNEITIVAVAALTNLALALKAAPEIASLVKEVVIMGGAFGENGHYGNVTPYAEANIYYDPHAAEIVFNASWSIVVIGLDVTKEVVYTADYFDKLRDNSGVVGDFIWDISQYYMRFYAKELGFKGCHMHDASAIGYIINPKLFTLREGVVSVKCSGKKIGQTTQQAINPQNKQIDFQTNIAINIDSTTLLDLFYNSIVNYSEA